jgi:hypothetical protein
VDDHQSAQHPAAVTIIKTLIRTITIAVVIFDKVDPPFLATDDYFMYFRPVEYMDLAYEAF